MKKLSMKRPEIPDEEMKVGFFRRLVQFIKGSNEERKIPWGFIFLACAVVWALVELMRSILYFFN